MKYFRSIDDSDFRPGGENAFRAIHTAAVDKDLRNEIINFTRRDRRPERSGVVQFDREYDSVDLLFRRNHGIQYA